MRTNYICTNCGSITSKWFGKCPECESWNTIIEQEIEEEDNKKIKNKARVISDLVVDPQNSKIEKINSSAYDENIRFQTGINEFDRVLGGGLVKGSVVLVSGEPGIGKSTLLLQICQTIGEKLRILYVTGEESLSQIKLRAKRVSVNSENLAVLSENCINKIIPEINLYQPDVVIIDSIQTMFEETCASIAGSVSQVKQATSILINKAKEDGISILIVGHVNKDGAIAGPKVLEHMVDAVLYFEGDKQHSYRIIRAIKNRYGSTNEIGMFEMSDIGLTEIQKPSEMILSQRPKDVPGSCATAAVEGSRAIITEIQALSTPTTYPAPRRMSAGLDYNRVLLVLAVLEKRIGLKFSMQDIYMNVAGGLHIDEPACDLAIALSLISSIKDIVVPDEIIAFGELGLAGECRSVGQIDQRLSQASRLGFKKALIPYKNAENIRSKYNMEIVPIRSVFDLLLQINKK